MIFYLKYYSLFGKSIEIGILLTKILFFCTFLSGIERQKRTEFTNVCIGIVYVVIGILFYLVNNIKLESK